MRRPDLDRYSPALRYALRLVERMGGDEVVLVPLTPSPTMIDAGARAGRVKDSTAKTVYCAMLRVVHR